MTSVAAIACSHGLGHLRRTAAVIDRLLRTTDQLHVDLFAKEDAWLALDRWPVSDRLNADARFRSIAFDSGTSLDGFLNLDRDCVRWHERLPDLRHDLVWSDNLVEILEQRPDAVLSGSFFWHEVVDDRSPGHAYVETARTLVDRRQPMMIGNMYFATPEVANLPNFISVGLHRFYEPVSAEKSGLYLGTGSASSTDEISSLISDLSTSAEPPTPFSRVWLEPRLVPPEAPPWVQRATYDAAGFATILVGCVRPGLGILSDLLASGARVHAVADSNFEMHHNGKRLAEIGVGASYPTYGSAVEAACRFARDEAARGAHAVTVGRLQTEGTEATVDALLSRLP